jgi:hypothetical protein
VQKVEHLGKAYVWNRLVDDRFDFDGGDPDGQRRAEHGAILGHRLGGDDGSELRHQAGADLAADG